MACTLGKAPLMWLQTTLEEVRGTAQELGGPHAGRLPQLLLVQLIREAAGTCSSLCPAREVGSLPSTHSKGRQRVLATP